MNARHTLLTALLFVFLSALPTHAAEKVRVFILAGQSNMEGKATMSLLRHQITDPKTADLFKHLHKNGEFIVRDDVFISYNNNGKMKPGGLTPGYGSPDRFGVELEFGNTMGDHFDEPVLLIKTAWGGKSIGRDFRPPSAGLPSDEELQAMVDKENENVRKHNEKNPNRLRPQVTLDDVKGRYGHFYREMIAYIKETLAKKDEVFPSLKGKQVELSGFVWFQGWNDQYGGLENEYEANMEAFIRDVRKALNAPKLPFVIGVMGQNGSNEAKGAMLTIQQAQLAQQNKPAFKGNVAAVRTDVLVDKAAEDLYPHWQKDIDAWRKVGDDRGYHYYGSAIWFSRMGDAFGEAMLGLMEEQ